MKPTDSTWLIMKSIAFKAIENCSRYSYLDSHQAVTHIEALFFLKLITDISNIPEFQTIPAWSKLSCSPRIPWAKLAETYDIAFRLDQFIQIIQDNNHAVLEGAFKNISFRNTFEEQVVFLRNLVETLSNANFQPWLLDDPREVGRIFEDLTDVLLEKSPPEIGEFSVPQDLATLIARIMDPRDNESILDPVCGSGRLLSALVRHAGIKHGPVAGQDWRPTALSICKMSLFAHGVSAQIKVGDPFRLPSQDEHGDLLKADIVIGNPPFGSRIASNDQLLAERPELFRRGLNRRIRREYAFVAHMLEVARERTGRVAVILPQGALFRQDEQDFRRSLIEENLLAGVLVLPSRLFTQTAISVAILIFNKGKTHKDVLFIDASRSFVTSGRQVRIPAHELERIVQALRDFKDIPGFCRVVSPKEIRDNNFQFSVTHYVPQEKTEEEDIDFEKLRKVISGTEAELAKVRTEIDSFIQSLRIKKL